MDRDIRLPKEINALIQNEIEITVICWNRENGAKIIEKSKGYKEIQITLKAPWGVKILIFLPLWWLLVFLRLLIIKWDVVHAINFDCVIPAVIAGRIKKKPIIYEILDVYEDTLVLPKQLRSVIVGIDKFFMRLSDATIVADEVQIEALNGIPNTNNVSIYDSPPETLYSKAIDVYQNLPNKIFTLFYAGALFKTKRLNLDKIMEVINDTDNTKLIVAGYGDIVDDVTKWANSMPNKIEFLGKISYAEVIRQGIKADLFFMLRDPAVLSNKYTCGSTLFNSMICGKPILVLNGSSTAQKVAKENCGLILNKCCYSEIRKSIEYLRDNPKLCKKLGQNGKDAFQQKYSWTIMERRLISLYKEIVSD